jgi:hypothetical protein
MALVTISRTASEWRLCATLLKGRPLLLKRGTRVDIGLLSLLTPVAYIHPVRNLPSRELFE